MTQNHHREVFENIETGETYHDLVARMTRFIKQDDITPISVFHRIEGENIHILNLIYHKEPKSNDS